MKLVYSKHLLNDRIERMKAIKAIGLGKGLFGVQWNTDEMHIVTSTGLILVTNKNNTSFVRTILIARPQQLARYGKPIPKDVLALASEHERNGLNRL